MAVRVGVVRGGRGRAGLATGLVLGAMLGGATAGAAQPAPELARQAEVRRTAYGVPHIRAENLRAAGYALGYVQMEDYGVIVARNLLRNRGELARHYGRDSLESDFRHRPNWLQAAARYPELERDTRDVYEGFAEGVNRYVQLHPAEFPATLVADFSGVDALATDMELPDARRLRRLLQRLGAPPQLPAGVPGTEGERPTDEGSNAWALAPGRTRSGHAILMRNPHLGWDAGYYEAHVVVPGVLDFYGDYRVGGPFQTIGGFNRQLGWSTTNNDVDGDEVYALDADPERPDHYLFDGTSLPLQRQQTTLAYRNGGALATETREHWTTPLGPVLHRANGKVYVWKVAGAGEFRLGQQWLRMMRAQSLTEWKQAMRTLGKPSSNFTYADAAGNIFYVWYGRVPRLPHASGGDTAAVPARSSADVFTHLLPFDSLPQLLNPKGGYLHQENDPFHYTNLHAVLDSARFPPNLPRPRLGLRSQHALELIHDRRRLSLDEVVRLKHSYRMLLADRVKPDLLAAVRAAGPAPEIAQAAELLARWDNTVAPESRGGVLFESWWTHYMRALTAGATPGAEVALLRERWTPARPLQTPRGLANAQAAAAAFTRAVEETKKRFGAWDVAWGEVHRVRHGTVDVPVGGCTGALGCFRVLWFDDAPDGKRSVAGGDGWVLAVEFGRQPRAYSVLGYGQSAKPASPHHADQAAMFARGELKPVALSEAAIAAQTVRRYHPGLEPGEAAVGALR